MVEMEEKTLVQICLVCFAYFHIKLHLCKHSQVKNQNIEVKNQIFVCEKSLQWSRGCYSQEQKSVRESRNLNIWTFFHIFSKDVFQRGVRGARNDTACVDILSDGTSYRGVCKNRQNLVALWVDSDFYKRRLAWLTPSRHFQVHTEKIQTFFVSYLLRIVFIEISWTRIINFGSPYHNLNTLDKIWDWKYESGWRI